MKFDFDYCKQLIDHMAKGKSYASFGAVIKVSFTTMLRWEKHIPEWVAAREIGESCLLNKWEDIMLGQAQGDIKGAPASTIFAVKNLLKDHFKENNQLQNQNGVTVIIDTGVPRALGSETYEMDEDGNAKIVENTLTLEENRESFNTLPKGLSFRDSLEVGENEKPLDVECTKGDDDDIIDEL